MIKKADILKTNEISELVNNLLILDTVADEDVLKELPFTNENICPDCKSPNIRERKTIVPKFICTDCKKQFENNICRYYTNQRTAIENVAVKREKLYLRRKIYDKIYGISILQTSELYYFKSLMNRSMPKNKMKVIFDSSKDEQPRHKGWIRIMKMFKIFNRGKYNSHERGD